MCPTADSALPREEWVDMRSTQDKKFFVNDMHMIRYFDSLFDFYSAFMTRV